MNKKVFTIVYFTHFYVSDRMMEKIRERVAAPVMPLTGGVYMASRTEENGESVYEVYVTNNNGPSGVLLKGADKKSGDFVYSLVELNKVNILDYELEGSQYVAISRWLKGNIGEFSKLMGNVDIEFAGFDNQRARLEAAVEPQEELDEDAWYDEDEFNADTAECDCESCKEVREQSKEIEPCCGEGECEDCEVAEAEMDLMVVGDEEVKSMEALFLLRQKDPLMANVLSEVLTYLSSTYGDKYAASPLSTMGVILAPVGKGFNMGNAAKYISRYITEGYSKSDNPQDVIKALHYCLFELMRRNNQPKANV